MRLALGLGVTLGVVVGCGGGAPPPAMQGREGMLSRTAIAQKCDEAAREHLRPFVIQWDATDLADFEAKARSGTILVRYEGCKLVPLYECSDPSRPFGSYGTPVFTSGTVQGFEIANEGELYGKLPLGAVQLSGRVQAGEKLHLEYFVSGVASSSRDALFRAEVDRLPSCKDATHYVSAYNLGAFELETSEAQSGSVEASGFGAGVGASKASSESRLGHGGKIESCSTQEQLACRVPIRVELRAIRPGEAPAAGAAAPRPAAPPDASDAMARADAFRQVGELMTDAAHKLNDQKDGAACLDDIARILKLAPEMRSHKVLAMLRARCLMRAGKCDEGTRDLRDHLAAEDSGRRKKDEDLDREAREWSNRECASREAANPADHVIRAARELQEAFPKDARTCRARFDEIGANMKRLGRSDPFERTADGRGGRVLPPLVACVAREEGCAAGKQLFERWLSIDNPRLNDTRKAAEREWPRFARREKLDACSPPSK